LQKKFRLVSRTISLIPPKIRQAVQSGIYGGLLAETRVHIRYRARGMEGAKVYTIHPLAITIADSVCYVVCTIDSYEDVRLLALHRIFKVEATDLPIVKPKGFDIDDYLGKGNLGFLRSGNSIEVEFLIKNSLALHLQETPLAAGQKVKPINAEWSKVTVSMPDTSQLRWWLRGFGPDVQVLRPESLRAEFVRESWLLSNHYSDRMSKRLGNQMTAIELERAKRDTELWDKTVYKNEFYDILSDMD
jgi:predicted DNA-binding transcriptional regulator YafY